MFKTNLESEDIKNKRHSAMAKGMAKGMTKNLN